MMRSFLSVFILLAALVFPAQAAPVQLREAINELRKRGATQLEGVVLSGTPVIKGVMGEQGFNASMRQCDRPEFACRVLIFRACKKLADTSFENALRLANTYNTQTEPRGYMLVTAQGGGPSICIQARYDLNAGNVLDQVETFAWQQSIKSYLAFLEEEHRSSLTESILE